MKELRAEILPKSRATVYLRRSENLLKAMDWAESEENADTLATTAVQAAIALGDAFTVSLLGRRSRGQDHHEILLLIGQCKAPSVPEVSHLLQRVLDRKGEAEYQSREVQLRDAKEISKHTRALRSIIRAELS